MKKDERVSTFNLEGRFVGFVGDGEKPKCIRLVTAQGERYIKLSKELRYSLRKVEPGVWLEVVGTQKYKYKTGELKLKACQVKLITLVNQPICQPPVPAVAAPKTKACVMVCQKSSCRKQGATEVCQAVTESLRDRGLADQVTLKGTGCMKECSRGPCVVFMPDKTRYTKVSPKEVPTLIEKHFAAKLKPEVSTELSPVT